MTAPAVALPLTPKWLDALIELDAAAGDWPWLRTQYEGSFEHHDLVLGWVEHEQLIALAVFQIVLDEASLLNFAVAAEYQSQGYGKQWFTAILKAIENKRCSKVFLELRESNIRAKKLYERMGFQTDGIRKNYYPSHNGREAAICMSLAIESHD
ncbi:ribosomal protein S18-alanine N-acetyltransferase [Leeia sp. TBRC 13508]|uniref:[Ribosomal protein bS18]-alanine N-acetyltransferase n=1 Tax=Leeia speluncae TaxID=2884804 RepID=A0ABS8D2S4_9NEIS|nr:ribosomal protein S18-alanine N-acetyltransferase [Leeia speluncae]MCB6182485.1 ribosomal protein S18-alanine N-acetyltransferase [Leeia speluncae]